MITGFFIALAICVYWIKIGRPNKQKQILDAENKAAQIREIRDPERQQEYPDVLALPDKLQKSLARRDILTGALSLISIILGIIFG